LENSKSFNVSGKFIEKMLPSLKISIITVSLNSSSFIEKAIKSLRSQTYPNVEHIVIDGGSTDGTLDIIKKYIDSIEYYISEPDSGIYNAMNKGISASTGDIVFFLNSDDYFADDRVLEDVASVFQKNPDIDIVFGNQIFDYEKKMLIKKQSFEVTRKQLARMTIQHQTLFARKIVFQLTGGFLEEYEVVADYDWILNVFLEHKCRFQYLDREISVMSTQGKSWSTNFEKERIEVMKKYFSNYEIFRFRMIPQKIKNFKKLVESKIIN
jgi:glycosyltransferase involved in cell wall biosynthesis